MPGHTRNIPKTLQGTEGPPGRFEGSVGRELVILYDFTRARAEDITSSRNSKGIRGRSESHDGDGSLFASSREAPGLRSGMSSKSDLDLLQRCRCPSQEFPWSIAPPPALGTSELSYQVLRTQPNAADKMTGRKGRGWRRSPSCRIDASVSQLPAISPITISSTAQAPVSLPDRHETNLTNLGM